MADLRAGTPKRVEASSPDPRVVPVGEPPTPEGWTIYVCGNCRSNEIQESNENDSLCADCGEWMNVEEVRVAPVGGAGSNRVRLIEVLGAEIGNHSTEHEEGVDDWRDQAHRWVEWLEGEQYEFVTGVGGTGVRLTDEEKTTVLDGYFATGDYECFVFDKHEGPAGPHDDGCRVYPDDLVPEGSKRKRGRWTISIRFEAASSVGEREEGKNMEARTRTTAEAFLEREAGGPHHRAVVVAELQSAAEGAAEEFQYTAGLEEYVALCRRLAEWEPVSYG